MQIKDKIKILYARQKEKLKNRRIITILGGAAFLLICSAATFSFYKAGLYPAVRNRLRQLPVTVGLNIVSMPNKIGWVTDIHADRFKRRSVESGTLFPRQYKDYLPLVFDEMKKEGIDTVIATGDNTNSCDDNYARDIKRIASEKNMYVVWVRGNHDCQETLDILGLKPKDGKFYYYYDYGKTRIVVLDDTQMDPYDYMGNIDQQQLQWLKTEALKTDKPVIVALHVPLLVEGKLLPRYSELEQIMHESGRVKLVLAGHHHVSRSDSNNGIGYYVGGALTYDGIRGQFATIDLADLSVSPGIGE